MLTSLPGEVSPRGLISVGETLKTASATSHGNQRFTLASSG